MELKPIRQYLEENSEFLANPDCNDSLQMSVDFYKVVGYNPPWICYYAYLNDELVGSAAYKGKPINNAIEIAYGTLPQFRSQGIGTLICKTLVHDFPSFRCGTTTNSAGSAGRACRNSMA